MTSVRRHTYTKTDPSTGARSSLTTTLVGDVRDKLREIPDESVHCVVTSPPYWGLRDYGVPGQLGLENTPEEHVEAMVEVFREVRRVLRSDGTLWLNYGDSYARTTERPDFGSSDGSTGRGEPPRGVFSAGLKPKDLVGMPWSVAKALQQPYYVGEIKAERDRAWMAAMIDGEGTICGFRHTRKDDGRERTGAQIFVTNSNEPILGECQRIWPASRHEHMGKSEGRFSDKDCYRWVVSGAERKAALLAELYPYLIAKKSQAHVAWNLLQFVQDGKRLGRGQHGDDVRAKRARLADILSALNHAEPVDLPSWLKPMPNMYEPGWYLRSDVIWKKPNPMPESVTDRPTSAHEHIFLLTKSARYYYDQEAVREKTKSLDPDEPSYRPNSARIAEEGRKEFSAKHAMSARNYNPAGRNLRNVWTIPTQPQKEAHFATFPEELASRCIKAGTSAKGVCPECGTPWVRVVEKTKYEPEIVPAGVRNVDESRADKVRKLSGPEYNKLPPPKTLGWNPCPNHPELKPAPATVLDPFGGSGTTAVAAVKDGRRAVLIELNPEYAQIAKRRCEQSFGLFL